MFTKMHNTIYTTDLSEYMEYTREFFADNEIDDPSDLDLEMFCYDEIDLCYEAEKCNLARTLPETIVCIADLGLWDGRHAAFREMGDNLNEILSAFDCDDLDVFVDDLGDVRSDGIHHDGTNHHLFRQWREGLSDEQKNAFREKLLSGRITRRDINRYTIRLGDYVSEIYGFRIRKKPERKALDHAAKNAA